MPATPATRHTEWVVLDLGETLVDETRCWSLWAEHLGVSTLTFFACMGAVIAERRPHTDVFEVLHPGFDLHAETERKSATGMGWSITSADLYDDALPTLRGLREGGYKIAVMANQPVEAEAFLSSLPIDLYATSAAWGVAKPDPEFFRRVAREVDAPANAIAYVGDRIDNDVVPANALGMLTIHLRRGPWGLIQAGWPEAVRADAHIDNLGELTHALASLAPSRRS